jgi:hypothetical protein
MQPYRYAILYHNYYSLEGIEDIRRRIRELHEPGILLLCSLPARSYEKRPLQGEKERFVLTENIGKDIGGKLLLIQLLLTLYPRTPYTIFLHDKKSYQKHSGYFERESLLSIIDKDKFRRIASRFDNDPALGIACAAGHIRNEHMGKGRFDTPNSPLLAEMIARHGIRTKDFRFAAGTMFWTRTRILADFFSAGSALDIRSTLEEGNVLDSEKATRTHCWERMFSWIATDAGYTLKEF